MCMAIYASISEMIRVPIKYLSAGSVAIYASISEMIRVPIKYLSAGSVLESIP